MNTAQGLFASAQESTDLGVIGSRRLVAVQTVDVARLTTHPVPIVPGSFVAVTGQGPKADSNGSGKTTFLSAVSLLLCDAQWRLNVDGRHAAGLLFQPESAGAPDSSGSAGHGYVIGVFARGASGSEYDLMTVWIRISRKPNEQHVLARYTHGLHVLHAETDQERADLADPRWDELPVKSECGSRSMAEKLYGMAPRCLAYLDTSIRPAVPSLLSQQMTQMSPALIGEALIALTGRDHLLDAEVKVRRRHAEQAELLVERLRDDEVEQIREKDQLAELERRKRARTKLQETDEAWEKYLAQGLIEKTDQYTEKEGALEDVALRIEEKSSEVESKKRERALNANRTDLAKAVEETLKTREQLDKNRFDAVKEIAGLDTALKELIRRRDELRPQAEGHDRRSVEEHAASVEALTQAETEARAEHDKAKTDYEEAVARLDAVREGREGLAGQALALLGEGEEPVAAVSILDVVAVDDSHRAEWEPRLWRYRDAVAVAPDDEARALERLSTLPGVVLVLTDGPLEHITASPAPRGVITTVPLSGFLHALMTRQVFVPTPDRVQDAGLAEVTLGGFGEPFTGREARIALAEAEAENALALLNRLVQKLQLSEQEAGRARGLLAAAQAAAELAGLRVRIEQAETDVGDAQGRQAELEGRWHEADEAYTKAKSTFDNHESKLEQICAELQRLQEEYGALKLERGRAERALENLGLAAWKIAWGRPHDAATELIGTGQDRVVRTAAGWRDHTVGIFQAALSLFAVDSGSVPAPLAELLSGRDNLAATVAQEPPDPQMYATLTRPLRDYLEDTAETDAVVRDRLLKGQDKRTRDVTALRTEIEGFERDLKTQQQMVEGSVELALQAISNRLNELDQSRTQYGAKLEIEIVRPVGPDSAWEWKVTPKWRRSPMGGFVSYKEAANGAQVKVYAIQLVLAALLADDSVPGRLLILDELGNSLGDTNRKDVLTALHRVARDEGVTILGTCQDSVIYDAADVCGEILWFYHAAATDPYNQPTRAWGFDPEHGRVELLAPWLREGRAFD
jgi:hypothetical protein